MCLHNVFGVFAQRAHTDMDELMNVRNDTIAVFILYHDTAVLKVAVNDSTANSSIVRYGGRARRFGA